MKSRASPVSASLLIGILATACAARMAAETPAIDTVKARQYFAEAKALSEKDHGALWRVSLCGPFLFVDYGTRYAVANQADREGQLKPLDGVCWDRAPGIGRGQYGDEVGWRRVDHRDLAGAAVQAAAHAVGAARVLASRAGADRLGRTGVRFFPQPRPTKMPWK